MSNVNSNKKDKTMRMSWKNMRFCIKYYANLKWDYNSIHTEKSENHHGCFELVKKKTDHTEICWYSPCFFCVSQNTSHYFVNRKVHFYFEIVDRINVVRSNRLVHELDQLCNRIYRYISMIIKLSMWLQNYEN